MTFCIINCKKKIGIEPEYIPYSYDNRNKISVEINGKIETDFKFFATIKSVSDRQYDTIPFPRYYDCPNSMEYIEISIPKEIERNFSSESLGIERFHPFIGVKQKLKIPTFPAPLVSPKNACDYDSTFKAYHGYILEQDLSGTYFKLNDKEQNDLTITSYDRISGKMTGEFNITLDKLTNLVKDGFYETLPKKLEYRNGKFTVYVKRY